jgi:hypothetical protein
MWYESDTTVQVLYLAAEAYEYGASASIGHNRSDRYLAAAAGLRRKAQELQAKIDQMRSDEESKALVAAFIKGFEGLEDISRLSFDRREAAMIGQLFAKQGKTVPERINGVRPYRTGHLLVDGVEYKIDYHDGKVSNATVELVG